MNAAQITAKINHGNSRVATVLGKAASQYRPASTTGPVIAAGNLVQSGLMVSYNAQDMAYRRPNLPGKSLWYAVLDATLVQEGDYLVSIDGTYFIAGMQTMLPILAVQCNRVVSIYRPAQSGVGILPYGGETPNNETTICTGFPASVLQGSKGDKSLVNLPGDIRIPWWAVQLPNLPGAVTLRNDDVMTDDLGKRYKISSCEQTDYGWRLSATESET
jgi:hypothetical protein